MGELTKIVPLHFYLKPNCNTLMGCMEKIIGSKYNQPNCNTLTVGFRMGMGSNVHSCLDHMQKFLFSCFMF